jgi:hypothetical protein
MSDQNRPAAGAQDGTSKGTRAGTAERERAIALLGEHWHAGRLDPAEHEGRVTQAKIAVTQADLDVRSRTFLAPRSPRSQPARCRFLAPAGCSRAGRTRSWP